MNMILNTDSYKLTMDKQYPPGTTGVYSYIESRGGKIGYAVFFGLQAFIKKYLLTPITKDDIDFAESIAAAHGVPFNRVGWEYILEKHSGLPPIVIRAVPEGTVVPEKNVLAVIENTDPDCYWLTTHFETALLRAIWYPTTVATLSHQIKHVILTYLEESGDPSTIDFKLHDFGARGVSSEESAAIGGAAHLINFKGTDTISGILFAKEYYDAGVAGFSIPASEHSTMTSWGRDNEVGAYRNMLDKFAKPGSIVAVVSDSYDIYSAANKLWGEALRQQVIDSGATVVIRPDSGDPATVCIGLINILGEKFGYTVNDKGFKVLNNVRIIQGDGVNLDSISDILDIFHANFWSADNIAFGMGGGLLQQVNRDTLKFAMKCSSMKKNGEWKDVQKDPITDTGKKSKAGRVSLWEMKMKTSRYTHFISAVEKPIGDWKQSLNVVYANGYLVSETTFNEIRKRANVLS